MIRSIAALNANTGRTVRPVTRSMRSIFSRSSGSSVATVSSSRTLNSAIDAEPLGELRGNSRTAMRIEQALAEPHGGDAQLRFDERQQLVFGDEAQLEQRFAEPLAVFRLAAEGRFESAAAR